MKLVSIYYIRTLVVGNTVCESVLVMIHVYLYETVI